MKMENMIHSDSMSKSRSEDRNLPFNLFLLVIEQIGCKGFFKCDLPLITSNTVKISTKGFCYAPRPCWIWFGDNIIDLHI